MLCLNGFNEFHGFNGSPAWQEQKTLLLCLLHIEKICCFVTCTGAQYSQKSYTYILHMLCNIDSACTNSISGYCHLVYICLTVCLTYRTWT